MRIIAAGAIVLGVLGQAQAAEPTAASLSRRALLAVAFPAWHPDLDASGKPAAAAVTAIALPTVAWPWKARDGAAEPTDQKSSSVHIVPLNVIRLDATHAAMVTWAMSTGDGLEPACDLRQCSYAIGTYFFVLDGETWRLSGRVDVADALGGESPPKTRVESWAGHGFVVGARMPHCDAGACADRLSLLGLAPDQLQFGFQAAVSYMAPGSGDLLCEALLDPAFKPKPDVDYSDAACKSADGNWRIDGDAIRIDFDETTRAGNADRQLDPVTESSFFVRLAPRDHTLKVIEGKLPDYRL